MTPQAKILKPDLIVFGGAFDPPHKGHTDCIKLTRDAFPNAELCVVPSFLAPINASENKISLASFEHRLEMSRIAFQKLAPKLQVLSIEKDLARPSYTIQTLHEIKKNFPHKNLGLLIGHDQLANFHLWFEASKILEIASLISIAREHIDLESALAGLGKNLHLELEHTSSSYVDVKSRKGIFIISESTTPISSRKLRQMLLDGEEIPDSIMSPEIFKYIQEHSLYTS